jgi:hypothetical protein
MKARRDRIDRNLDRLDREARRAKRTGTGFAFAGSLAALALAWVVRKARRRR